jgi:hypothetical protein
VFCSKTSISFTFWLVYVAFPIIRCGCDCTYSVFMPTLLITCSIMLMSHLFINVILFVSEIAVAVMFWTYSWEMVTLPVAHLLLALILHIFGNPIFKSWPREWLSLLKIMWSSGQNSRLQIQMSEFYSWRYQIFWEVVGLEWGPLSLVITLEELLGRRRRSYSGLESQEYGHRDPSCWPRGTLYPQKLALTSLTNGGRSVSIVCSWTQAMEFGLVLNICY